jgi:outer membrane protein TolC
VGPDFHRPDAPAVTHYTNGANPKSSIAAHGSAQTFDPDAPHDFDWWQLFQLPQLNAVVREALEHNPGLAAARASQDNLRSGYGIFFLPSTPRSVPRVSAIAP